MGIAAWARAASARLAGVRVQLLQITRALRNTGPLATFTYSPTVAEDRLPRTTVPRPE
jgi:hypothetical protein